MLFLKKSGCAAAMLCVSLASAVAQQTQYCGAVPQLPQVLLQDENLKAQVQKEAKGLSESIGESDFSSKVESSRRTIYQNSQPYFAAHLELYLNYMFCIIVMEDTKKSLEEKAGIISAYKKSVQEPALTLSDDDRRKRAGTYFGHVMKRDRGRDSFFGKRYYKFVMPDSLENGKVVMYSDTGKEVYEVAVDGRMADKRTFVGKSAIVKGSGSYYPDNLELTFSPEDNRVTWYQLDPKLDIEGFGTLFKTEETTIQRRVSNARRLTSDMSSCQRVARGGAAAYFLVVPLIEKRRNETRYWGRQLDNGLVVQEESADVYSALMEATVDYNTDGYEFQLYDQNAKRPIVFKEPISHGATKFAVHNGVQPGEDDEPGQAKFGFRQVGSKLAWDTKSFKWDHNGKCTVVFLVSR